MCAAMLPLVKLSAYAPSAAACDALAATPAAAVNAAVTRRIASAWSPCTTSISTPSHACTPRCSSGRTPLPLPASPEHARRTWYRGGAAPGTLNTRVLYGCGRCCASYHRCTSAASSAVKSAE